MIDEQTVRAIQSKVQQYWDELVQDPDFVKKIEDSRQKEAGHQIADWVDTRTTGFLAAHYFTAFQFNKRGRQLTRSMGDIWLEYRGIYHPVNVKTGVSSTNGQPNMVSLKKLLDALLGFQIDSYYLLMIKFDVQTALQCKAYFVDMLDYLDCITFDSGPGQIMLKAKKFFETMSQGTDPIKLSTKEKVKRLFDLLEDGERRLALNRKRDLDSYRLRIQEFDSVASFIVSPETQSFLNLRARG